MVVPVSSRSRGPFFGPETKQKAALSRPETTFADEKTQPDNETFNNRHKTSEY